MELTEYSETSAHKIQKPGIAQKKEYKIQNTTKVWNQEETWLSSLKQRKSIVKLWIRYLKFKEN